MRILALSAALWLSTFGLARALFVPEELPTLLSFLYTNIPPVFKGTDSRLGLGFRVGPNADFQIQVELGPQTRTQLLGPDAEASSKKRHVSKHELDQIYAPSKIKHIPDTPIGWLQSWKASVGAPPQQIEDEETKPIRQPTLDYDVVKHLHQLYKEQPAEDVLSTQ